MALAAARAGRCPGCSQSRRGSSSAGGGAGALGVPAAQAGRSELVTGGPRHARTGGGAACGPRRSREARVGGAGCPGDGTALSFPRWLAAVSYYGGPSRGLGMLA